MSLRRHLVATTAAALLLLSSGLSRAADVPISEEARGHFKAGVAYLDDPDGSRYEEAYREFKAAYAASPSPKILGNLGLCAMKLERDGEAIDAYTRYLAEVPDIKGEEKDQITKDLKTLRSGVVRLKMRVVPTGAKVQDARQPVSGDPVVNRYDATAETLEIGVRPGHHKLTFELEGHEPAVWEFDASPGQALDKDIALKKSEPTGPREPAAEAGVPTGFWVGVAVTGALAVGAAVTGGLALSKQSEYSDLNDGSDPTAAQDVRDAGGTLNIVTDVLMGSAVVAAGVTVALYFVLQPDEPEGAEPSAAEPKAAWTLAPAFGLNAGAVMLTGQF